MDRSAAGIAGRSDWPSSQASATPQCRVGSQKRRVCRAGALGHGHSLPAYVARKPQWTNHRPPSCVPNRAKPGLCRRAPARRRYGTRPDAGRRSRVSVHRPSRPHESLLRDAGGYMRSISNDSRSSRRTRHSHLEARHEAPAPGCAGSSSSAVRSRGAGESYRRRLPRASRRESRVQAKRGLRASTASGLQRVSPCRCRSVHPGFAGTAFRPR